MEVARHLEGHAALRILPINKHDRGLAAGRRGRRHRPRVVGRRLRCGAPEPARGSDQARRPPAAAAAREACRERERLRGLRHLPLRLVLPAPQEDALARRDGEQLAARMEGDARHHKVKVLPVCVGRKRARQGARGGERAGGSGAAGAEGAVRAQVR